VFGTDRFIAPELLGGGLPEPRNDIYSVGALMYSMLTAQCVPDLSAAPELMELPSPRAFVPALPQSVDDIVMRALSDVQARFETAEEMAAAIRAALTEETASSSANLRVRRETAPASKPSTSPRDWHAVSELQTEVTPASSASDAAGSGSGSTAPVHALPALPSELQAEVTPASSASDAASSASAAPVAPVDTPPVLLAPVPAASAMDGPARTMPTRWAIAAAMVISAVLGGGAVWIARPAPDSFVVEAGPTPRADSPQPAKETGTKPEQQTPSEAMRAAASSPAPTVVPPTKSPRPAVLAAGDKPRSTTAVGARSPNTRRGQSFPQVMRGLEDGISDCIARKTGKGPVQAVDVRVRFAPSTGEIDQVRVLDMGATNPIAGCVDKAVRDASPPSAGRPNENFTFFNNMRAMPK